METLPAGSLQWLAGSLSPASHDPQRVLQSQCESADDPVAAAKDFEQDLPRAFSPISATAWTAAMRTSSSSSSSDFFRTAAISGVICPVHRLDQTRPVFGRRERILSHVLEHCHESRNQLFRRQNASERLHRPFDLMVGLEKAQQRLNRMLALSQRAYSRPCAFPQCPA